MLRTVADDTPSPAARTSSEDATGSPDAMYSQTSVARTRLDRSLSSISTLGLRLLTALYNSGLGVEPRGRRLPVEQQRHRLEQAVDRARLFEEGFAVPQGWFALEELIGVAGQVQHLQVRVHLAQPRRELVTLHARHFDVGEKQIGQPLLFAGLQRGVSTGRRHRFVPGDAQHLVGELDD